MNTIKTADGNSLYVKVWGTGRPVILIHGWPLNADSWDDQAMAIAAAGYQTIAYDRRGFGRSSQPWSGYEYDTLADDLAAVIDQTAARDATLIGFSMGGGEVARYMSRHAGKSIVKTALVSSILPYMLKTESNQEGTDAAVFAKMASGIAEDRATFFADFFKNFYGVGILSHPVSQENIDWARSLAMQASLKATLDCATAFSSTDFRPEMSAFKVPTLIVHGTGDKTVPIAGAARAAHKAIPQSTLIEYEGAPHGLTLTEKNRLNRDLLEFYGVHNAMRHWVLAGLIFTAGLRFGVAQSEDVSPADADSAGEYGSTPALPAPSKSLLPTLNVAKAQPWRADAGPMSAPGTQVIALARNLRHPRWLYVLPNGDVLVAETEAPVKPDDGKGLRGMFQKHEQRRAGSGANPSANRISLLRAAAGSVERHVFLEGLNAPIGMALIGDALYVANTDSLVRFTYQAGDTVITAPPVLIVDLPGGPINHHWTKTLLASPDGTKLYAGVGSNSNVGEHGVEAESGRDAIWEIDPETRTHRLYATGLRNPVGLAWEPVLKKLWVAVNERDELGDHVPPDYMTSVTEGGFYGFPYSYYGQHVDYRVTPQDPVKVARALSPDYALGAHTASLGLCWSGDTTLPEPFKNGMFVGQHGSWNRKVPSGYKVVFIAFQNGKPRGLPIEVLSGFLDARGVAHGRPVGVAMDHGGNLLVADDVGNTVWQVSAVDQRPR